MTKKKIFILITSVVVIMSMLSSCAALKSKGVITGDTFSTIMESHDFTVTDSTEQYKKSTNCSQCLVADNSNYKIFFISFGSDDAAKAFFTSVSEQLASSKSSSSVEASVNLKQHSSYTLTSNGKHDVLKRVESTVIMVSADSVYKDEINAIIDETGY